MSFNTKILAESLQRAEKALAEQPGPFVLFGLFEQEGTPGRWDVLAAPWLTSSRAGIGHLIAGFEPYLPPEQTGSIQAAHVEVRRAFVITSHWKPRQAA